MSKEAIELLNAGANGANKDETLTAEELAAKAALEAGTQEGDPTEEELAAQAQAKLDAENQEDPTLQEEFDTFKVDSEKQITDLKSEVEALKGSSISASEAFTKDTEDLVEIVAGYVGQMRMKLSLAKVDMTTFSVKALMTEYTSTLKSFEKSLPIGGAVPQPKTKVNENKEVISDSIEASAYENLGFK